MTPLGQYLGMVTNAVPAPVPLPSLSSALLWLPTACTAHQWTEAADSVAATHPSVNGNPVGQLDDPSSGAHTIRSTSAARRPTLAVGGGRGAGLRFGPAATTCLRVDNSLSAFNIIHTTRTFTIALWVKAVSDGVSGLLLDNSNGTSANAGFYLSRTSANKILFLITKASAGNAVLVYTSTATITVADGWVPITIVCSAGSGTLQVGAAAAEPFTCNAGAVAGTNAWSNLVIGNDASAQGSAFNGWISDLGIWNIALDSTALAAYRSYNPTLSSVSLASGSGATVDSLNFLQTWWDASDTAYLWQDTARTTPVAANSDPVGVLANKTGQLLNRDATQATAGLRPLWKTNIAGGNPALLFNGTDSELGFATWNTAGAQTLFFVVKNLDNTYGSHFIIGAADNAPHWVVTGLNYSGNDSPGEPYVVLHMVAATTPSGAFECGKLGNPSGFNVIEVVRNGATWMTYMDGILIATYAGEGAAYNTFTRLGPPGGGVGANWWLDGYVCEYAKYNAAHSASRRGAVRAGLASKWGVANVH